MSRLRVLALACEGDRPTLASRFVREARPDNQSEFDCEPLFRTRALNEEDISVASFSALWARGRAEELRLLEATFEQSPNVLLVFVGACARNSPDFDLMIRRILEWRRNRPGESKRIVIVQTTSLDIDVFDWPDDALRLKAPWAEEPGTQPIDRLFAEFQDLFGAAVLEAVKGFQQEPEVGIGGLLIGSQGRFLLAERLRTPGKGMLGTFGGSLPHMEQPDRAILKQAEKQFGIHGSSITVGSLLACTNMMFRGVSGAGNHYIDLTFLALADNEVAQPRDKHRHKLVQMPDGPRCWFTLEEVCHFYLNGRLFPPVANALHRYCSWAALGHIAAATDSTTWLSIKNDELRWMQKFHANDIATLTRIAADGNRNQISPIFYDNH